jgi:probable rRNA maturation factor
MPRINFFSEEIIFKVPHPRKTKSWLASAVANEGFALVQLNYIFCSDRYLVSINKEYLGHSTLTDIVTFDNSDNKKEVEGDIFISTERVMENAAKFMVPKEAELRRVMVHGALHLMGYRDKTDREKVHMRKKEDAYLSLWE